MGEENARMMACVRCRNRVPVNEMKFASNAKDLICHTCYLGQKDPRKTESLLKVDKSQPKGDDGPCLILNLGCTACGYRFKVNTCSNIRKDKCPYCYSENIIDMDKRPFL
ncbi:hypothetical protein ACFL1H_04255 [Nanoarchaeota archaeon]